MTAPVSPVAESPHASDYHADHDSEMDHDDGHDDGHDDHPGRLPRDPVAAGILPPPRQRACASCARLKIKCGWPARPPDDGHGRDGPGSASTSASDGRPCIRCARLKVKCLIPDRVKRQKKVKTTRVSQLEQKLDGIVSLLAARNVAALSQASPPLGITTSSSSKPQSHPTSPTTSTPATSIAALLTHPPNAPPTATSSRNAPPPPPKPDDERATEWQFSSNKNPILPSPVSHASPDAAVTGAADCFSIDLATQKLSVSAAQAADYLRVYALESVPACPLVPPLPAEMQQNPAALHASAPLFFWSIIATIAPLDAATQVEYRRWFRLRAADHILVSPLPPAHPAHRFTGLAVLQAILVHTAWCDTQGFIDSQITSLLHLTLALVAELRLDRPFIFKDPVAKNLLKDARCSNGPLGRPPHAFPIILSLEERTLAERRAVLGFYCLTSVLFQRNGYPMAYSPSITQFADALLKAKEFPTDTTLVAIVQMMATIEPIVYGPLSRDLISDPNKTLEYTETLHMAIQHARREIDTVVASFDESVTSQFSFRLFHLGCIIRLYEPIIAVRALPTTVHFRSSTLWNALAVAETILETYISMPPSTLVIQPITTTVTILPAMMCMARLLLLDVPFPSQTGSMADVSRGWDSAAARNRFDFVALTGRLIGVMELLEDTARREGRRLRVLAHGAPAFVSEIDRMRWIRRWFASKLHGQKLGPEECKGDGGSDERGEALQEQQQLQLLPSDGMHQQQQALPQSPQQPQTSASSQQYPLQSPASIAAAAAAAPQFPNQPGSAPPYPQQPQTQTQPYDPQAFQFYGYPSGGRNNDNGTGMAIPWLESMGIGVGPALVDLDPSVFQSFMDDIMMGMPQNGFTTGM